ncbi:MAG TPA: hypothetical protein VHY91_21590 [Pirellulales bacterium]|jgi:hypothetical protein|nr:hypothetical protein [Pirellulales bacterium]
MKRQLTLLGALAVAICFAQSAAAQELVRVYTPQSYAAVGTTTNYGYGVAPVWQTSNYAPVTTYYAPEVVVPTTTYYSPVPTTTYYAPAVVPTTTYYAPAVIPTTTYYAPTTAYYAPVYGRTYYYSPAPLVPGQPIRNAFRAMTW